MDSHLTHIIDFLQVATLVVSFLTNLMSTSTIGFYVWYVYLRTWSIYRILIAAKI